MTGLIIVDKPSGISSARVVAKVKRLAGGSVKVGHAGTLDPFATGILNILVGKATRACEQVMNCRKTYEATIKLGATTETDDPESPERPSGVVGVVERDRIEEALKDFVGTVQQRPPLYSAIKIGGKRACDRARQGMEVDPKPRDVHVYSLSILDYRWPLLKLRIQCGRGTYIRSIARDFGQKLGTGGYLTELRRTRVGEYGIERAVALDQLTAQNLHLHLQSLPLVPSPVDKGNIASA